MCVSLCEKSGAKYNMHVLDFNVVEMHNKGVF